MARSGAGPGSCWRRDLVVRSRGPIPEHVLETIDGAPGAVRAEVREMAAMVGRASAPGSVSGSSVAGRGGRRRAVESAGRTEGGVGRLSVLWRARDGAAASGRNDTARTFWATTPRWCRRRLCPGSVWRSVTSCVWAGGPLRIIGSLEAEPDRLPTGFAFAATGHRRHRGAGGGAALSLRRFRRLPRVGAAAGRAVARGA